LKLYYYRQMNSIQIGLLLPTSTIFPIAKDFEKGLKQGLGDASSHVEIIKEFIGQGNTKQTEQSIGKLFTYDDVDVITGILSGRVTEVLAPRFLSAKKPFLVSELGEYLPNPSKLNEYIFLNSNHLWQHAWTMGNWGVKTFGKKGMFLGSVYDAAYSFSHMFHEGMMAADPGAQWSFSIPPMPPNGALSDMSVIFPFLEKYEPDFVFAAFCGTEATLFLNEFIKQGWHKRTVVTGLPFLLDPFKPVDDDMTIYTTLPNSEKPQMAAKESFFDLGQRSGNIIAEALATGDIYKGLSSSDKTMSLGNTHFISQRDKNDDTIAIVENKIQANATHILQSPFAESFTFSVQDEKLASMIPEINVGWQNPYLCI
jgi:branched-chain amino acid transport system substrate-binding protein